MSNTLNALAGLNGLQKIQKIMNGEVDYAPMMKTMPLKIVEAEKGRVVLHAMPDERHLNLQGAVHGGFVATIMDTITGFTVLSALEESAGHSTIDLGVKMLKPVQPGVTLIAEGRVIKVGRTIAVADGTISDANGSIYAHGSATYMLKQPAK